MICRQELPVVDCKYYIITAKGIAIRDYLATYPPDPLPLIREGGSGDKKG